MQKKTVPREPGELFWYFRLWREMSYIIPSIPPPIGGIAGLSSFLSASTQSVVSSIPAIEEAFSSATRDTLVGSITPAASRFSNTSLRALKPKSAVPSLIFCTIMLPSRPALATIWRSGSSIARRTMFTPKVSSSFSPLRVSSSE